MQNFETLGLSPTLVQAVSTLGYQKPTPIQAEAIPLLLTGYDVLGQAQTGTGKTAAFTLPMLHRLDPNVMDIQALVLTPTRELAIQVSQAIFRYGNPMGVRVLPIYGGQSYQRQLTRLQQRQQIIVGTPGRTLDLIRQGALRFNHIQYLVLDEADEMLKMGFQEDIEAILATIPKTRQTTMFSATLSKPILKLATRYMNSPVEVSIQSETKTVTAITQSFHLVNRQDKLAALSLVLEQSQSDRVLIFTKTRVGASELAEALSERGYIAAALHGDLTQAVRETVLRRFRKGDLHILIGTDVMARGVDIPEVSHVINFDLPMTVEEYVHRIGRTGRAGRKGQAITLVTPPEIQALDAIQRYTNQPILRLPLPTPEDIYNQRDVHFLSVMSHHLQNTPAESNAELIEELQAEGYSLEAITAAAIQLARLGETQRPIERVRDAELAPKRKPRPTNSKYTTEKNMVKLAMGVGKLHGVHPADVVGAVARGAGISGRAIGAIEVRQNETFFDVKAEVANQVLKKMGHSTLRGAAMNLRRV